MGSFAAHVENAIAHHRAGRLDEAEAAYRAALVLAPGHAAVAHNLGVVVATKGDHVAALACFDRVIADQPDYASAHYNRAIALAASGRTGEAIAGFRRTCLLEPGHYDSHRALGFLCLQEGDRGRALDHFARTYELRRGEDRTGMAASSLTSATSGKLRHDADQFRYLASRRREGKRFEMLARVYENIAGDLPANSTVLDRDQLETLGDDYNPAIHIAAAPEASGSAVSQRLDARAITQAFNGDGCGAVWFDGLLAETALSSLRRFLLESTIWHDFDHIGGFVASYLEDGLACPLLLQIADELRTRFPDVLRAHPLSQAWAFKGLTPEAAVDAHADDGAISVNFWVTPDAANLDRDGGGGLRICRAAPPAAWQISGYVSDMAEIAAFLDDHRSDTMVVPYRENRAAMFQSRLFHRSDAPRFAKGYANHRINVTLLFGRHAA